jgi:hypothetical protein
MTKPKDPAKLEAYLARERLRKAETPEQRAKCAAQVNALAGSRDLPEGHRLKGVSVLTDAAGKLDSRWDKTERATTAAATVELPPQFAIKKVARFTDAQGETRGEWRSFDQSEVDRAAAFKKAFTDFASSYEFRTPLIRYEGNASANVHNVIPIGDAHIGLLAHEQETGNMFDLKIAERELCAAVDLLIDQAPAANSCNIVNLGDWFHAQDDNQLTPRGKNKQDVDGRIFKIITLSLSMIERMCERALAKFERVTFTMVPGNHDPQLAQVFAIMLARIMRDNPRLHVPSNLDACIVDTFGDCMFLYNHTDKMKLDKLARVMASRYAEIWGKSKHRFIHGGHVHHSEIKEDLGVTSESHNTLAGQDAWHRGEGYDSKRLCKLISYHNKHGEIHRHTVTRERVLAYLEGSEL